MYFLWAKINMASYGHTMFSLKLLILIVIRQCSMACFRTKCWWEVGGVGSAFPPGTILLGPIPNNINMPLLWAIINNARIVLHHLTLLNSELIRKHSVQFLGSCI